MGDKNNLKINLLQTSNLKNLWCNLTVQYIRIYQIGFFALTINTSIRKCNES